MEQMVNNGMRWYYNSQKDTYYIIEGNAVNLWSAEVFDAWLKECSDKYYQQHKRQGQ